MTGGTDIAAFCASCAPVFALDDTVVDCANAAVIVAAQANAMSAGTSRDRRREEIFMFRCIHIFRLRMTGRSDGNIARNALARPDNWSNKMRLAKRNAYDVDTCPTRPSGVSETWRTFDAAGIAICGHWHHRG